MTEFEGVVESTVLAVAEVQVNDERLRASRARLLNHVHGTTLLDEDVLVGEIEVLLIVFIADEVLAARLTSNRRRTSICSMNSTVF